MYCFLLFFFRFSAAHIRVIGRIVTDNVLLREKNRYANGNHVVERFRFLFYSFLFCIAHWLSLTIFFHHIF